MNLRRLAVTVVITATFVSACSLGEKEAITDRVVASITTGRPAAVTVDLGVSIRRAATGGDPSVTAGALGGGMQPVRWTGTFDPATGRSAVLAPAAAAARLVALGADPTRPLALVVADRESLAVRRPAGEVVAARPWFQLDTTGEVREVTKPDMTTVLTGRAASDAVVLTPTLLVSLLSGTLPGSVEEDGNTISGRISLDKAAREDDLDDDEIETRARALQIYAITQDVHDFILELAPDGSIARLQYEFISSPNKQTRLLLTWSMTVTGDGVMADPPPPDDTIRISSFAQARGAVDEWTGRS